MYYSRRILGALIKQIDTKEIIVLTGMRRVGKTTVLRMIFDQINSDNKVFLDLENILNQKIFEEENFDNIWANLKQFGISTKVKSYIFLDEIGAMPKVTPVIKYLYDHYNVKFFLTGSSSFYLKNLFPESLAGRKVIFDLYPLDFAEFLVFKQIQKQLTPNFNKKDQQKNKIFYQRVVKLFDEYLQFGGFPQVVLKDDISQKESALEDIFKSYFEKDVTTLADFKNITAFRDLLLLLLSRIGSKLDISKLSREIGISRETVYSYISFLEGTYFIRLIPQFSQSMDRQISGAKKIYLCDNGMVNKFARISEGSLFENAVFLNLRKYGDINFYQSRAGSEIDFILRTDSLVTGLEVKNSGTRSDYDRLRRISQKLGLTSCFLITRKFTKESGFIPAVEL